MKVLVIGSGGREHALVRKLLVSPSCKSVVCAPGSHGIAREVPCIDITTHREILSFCQLQTVDLIIVGPEEPLVTGLADLLREHGFAVFGPGKLGAQLEASKDFTKKLCDKYDIPTAAYATFETREDAKAYIKAQGAPIVVKADGLAGGKGVTVAMTEQEACNAVDDCFDGIYSAPASRVVIEEMLKGDEVSFFALCDGKTAISFASAQDYKRAYDGNKGPNTGGMGSFSPTPLVTQELEETIMRTIIEPTLSGLGDEGIPYVGVLFAGLMLTKTGPKLIEYNCRFGDPETQSMLARFTGDFAALLLSCAVGHLNPEHMQFSDEVAVCVVMAASGYPGKYTRGTLISNVDRAASAQDVTVLHAGTSQAGEHSWLAQGGRVLNVVATGASLRQARYRAYEAIDLLDWPDGFCRRDIAAQVTAG